MNTPGGGGGGMSTGRDQGGGEVRRGRGPRGGWSPPDPLDFFVHLGREAPKQVGFFPECWKKSRLEFGSK